MTPNEIKEQLELIISRWEGTAEQLAAGGEQNALNGCADELSRFIEVCLTPDDGSEP